jgi:hypothetical protein
VDVVLFDDVVLTDGEEMDDDVLLLPDERFIMAVEEVPPLPLAVSTIPFKRLVILDLLLLLFLEVNDDDDDDGGCFPFHIRL